jgi:hypothetical protein
VTQPTTSHHRSPTPQPTSSPPQSGPSKVTGADHSPTPPRPSTTPPANHITGPTAGPGSPVNYAPCPA